ncbi:hypothetical protein MASR2M78_27940 [Treponema sp.]
MEFKLGVKSDPIEYRYTYDWLFDLMKEQAVEELQLGTFFELYALDDAYFTKLRSTAEKRGIRIRSVFTAHRELGGFFTADPLLEKVARRNYERLIEVAALLGSEYVGSNPGAVYRNRMETKASGIDCYLSHMKELMKKAKKLGLRGLTLEPMSCLGEPPSTPDEIDLMMHSLQGFHARTKDTVNAYLCGDISHGLADSNKNILFDNVRLFEHGLKWMSEFHFKNTDAIFGSTFGFGKEELSRGIVDLKRILEIVYERIDDWPVATVVGYLEIGGPKLGRDYSDPHLAKQLSESLEYIKGLMR